MAQCLRRDLPDCKVIICSMYTYSQLITEAFAVGVVGFVRKQSAHADLIPTIRAAVTGGAFVSPSLEYNAAQPQTNGGADDAVTAGWSFVGARCQAVTATPCR